MRVDKWPLRSTKWPTKGFESKTKMKQLITHMKQLTKQRYVDKTIGTSWLIGKKYSLNSLFSDHFIFAYICDRKYDKWFLATTSNNSSD